LLVSDTVELHSITSFIMLSSIGIMYCQSVITHAMLLTGKNLHMWSKKSQNVLWENKTFCKSLQQCTRQ